MSGTRFHRTWKQMKKRGTNPSYIDVRWYGENGVGLHERWKSFESFRDDMYSSYLEHAAVHGEKKTTIDRISTDHGYHPWNVRWATPKRQSRNQRRVPKYEHNGRSLALADWAEIVGIDACTLKMRLRIGWTVERALTTQVTPSKRGIWKRKKRRQVAA